MSVQAWRQGLGGNVGTRPRDKAGAVQRQGASRVLEVPRAPVLRRGGAGSAWAGGLATAIPPRAHCSGGGSNNPTSQQNDMGTGMWCAVLTFSLITGCVCQNGPCHRSQHGNIIARGCTGGPCTRGAGAARRASGPASERGWK